MTRHPTTSRTGSTQSAVLVALLFLAGVGIALALETRKSSRSGRGANDSTTTRPVTFPRAETALGISTVRNLDNQEVPLVVEGEPAVIMISSEVCEWCKQTLKDLRVMSAGRALPRLRLLTLEGAAEGRPMVEREGLTGLHLLGPPDNKSSVSLTFRFQGTPTFFAIDAKGRVIRALPGYQERAMLTRLYNVMVGDADVP